MRFFWNLYLRITGWTLKGSFPYHTRKCVILVGPHTSNWDFIVGLAFRSRLRLTHAHFLAKAELFRAPFGFLFRKLGGVPVERSANNRVVDQAVSLFNSRDSFILVLSPEGTRKKVARLRTGFYHIAKEANVPLVMAALDFENKEVSFSAPFFTTFDERADFEKIYRFYAPVNGKHPAQGMSHFLSNVE